MDQRHLRRNIRDLLPAAWGRLSPALLRKELGMPTALPFVSDNSNISLARDGHLNVADKRDSVIVAAITAIGVLLTFTLTTLFPLAGHAVSLALASG